MPRQYVTSGCLLVCLLLQAPLALAQAAARPVRPARTSGTPASAGRFDRGRLAGITKLIEEAIARKELPGAVVAVGTEAGVAWQASVGQRALQPAREPMTADTIFDAASL